MLPRGGAVDMSCSQKVWNWRARKKGQKRWLLGLKGGLTMTPFVMLLDTRWVKLSRPSPFLFPFSGMQAHTVESVT